MAENVHTGHHMNPSADSTLGNCVSVCAAAPRQNSAPVRRAGVRPPRPLNKARPRNAPTAPPRARSSSVSPGFMHSR